MKLFSTAPALLFVPALIVSLLVGSVSDEAQAKVQQGQGSVSTQRRLRIERLLISLDRVAEVALQMKPETTQRLEPVIVDLAEQTLELVGSDEIQNVKTDTELDRLETTVGELVNAMNKVIEPEMSL